MYNMYPGVYLWGLIHEWRQRILLFSFVLSWRIDLEITLRKLILSSSRLLSPTVYVLRDELKLVKWEGILWATGMPKTALLFSGNDTQDCSITTFVEGRSHHENSHWAFGTTRIQIPSNCYHYKDSRVTLVSFDSQAMVKSDRHRSNNNCWYLQLFITW